MSLSTGSATTFLRESAFFKARTLPSKVFGTVAEAVGLLSRVSASFMRPPFPFFFVSSSLVLSSAHAGPSSTRPCLSDTSASRKCVGSSTKLRMRARSSGIVACILRASMLIITSESTSPCSGATMALRSFRCSVGGGATLILTLALYATTASKRHHARVTTIGLSNGVATISTRPHVVMRFVKYVVHHAHPMFEFPDAWSTACWSLHTMSR
mmetsp:Transcript_3556/g.11075  ORF Transcript_3556/g.11075 Transcript_3556/m.11075 type:complete len:212 (-) Transcript_3556:1208-1843(-)